jgi:hypothetical protein
MVEILEWVLEEENWKAFRAARLTRVSEVVEK